MESKIQDVYNFAKRMSGVWDVDNEGARVIITCPGIFRCFISRAYEVKTHTFVLSAHLLLLTDLLTTKLIIWDTRYIGLEIPDRETTILTNIFKDLRTIESSNRDN